jgi:hypothetical protein
MNAVFRLLLLAAAVGPMSGCATKLVLQELTGARPDLELVKVGAPRTVIERELGAPARTEHNVAVYELYVSSTPQGQALFMLPGAIIIDMATWGVMLAGPINRKERENTKRWDIVYGPAGNVISLSHTAAAATFREWMDAEADRQGDLERLARSANEGYAPAQMLQAVRYRYGLWNTAPDAERAYLWARLAEHGGHRGAQEMRTGWARAMSAEQRAAADAKFQAWEPEAEHARAPFPLPPTTPTRLPTEEQRRVPSLGDPTVNCIAGGERRWVPRSQCD